MCIRGYDKQSKFVCLENNILKFVEHSTAKFIVCRLKWSKIWLLATSCQLWMWYREIVYMKCCFVFGILSENGQMFENYKWKMNNEKLDFWFIHVFLSLCFCNSKMDANRVCKFHNSVTRFELPKNKYQMSLTFFSFHISMNWFVNMLMFWLEFRFG